MFRQNNFLALNFFKVFFLISAVLVSGSSIARISAERDNGRPLDELEEVLVTAEFRDRAYLESTGGISILQPHSDSIANQHLEDVLGQAVNVSVSSGSSRARFYQIRGIGERGQFGEPLNSSVGLVIDGVDFSGFGTAAVLLDVAQIEVLRGPQGTLYGANALAGLINIVSAEPTEDFSGRLQLDVGNFDALGLSGFISGTTDKNIGYRVSASSYVDDGFIENIHLDREDTDKHDEKAFKLKLKGETRSLDWTLALGLTDVKNGYDAFSLDNDRRSRSDQPGADQQTSRHASVNLRRRFAENSQLELNVGFANSDILYGYDEDWTFEGFHPWGYSSTDYYDRSVNNYSIDLRWTSNNELGRTRGFNWVTGIYRFVREVDLERDYTWFEVPYVSKFDVSRSALYGQGTFSLSDRLSLSTGLRLEGHDSTFMDSFDARFSPQDSLLGGKAVLEMLASENSRFHASISKGYKSGGFNTSGSLDEPLRLFEPEILWNIELGWIVEFEKSDASLRALLFKMDRSDVQISTSIVRVREDGSSEFVEFTGNAAEGVNQGLELEYAQRVNDFARIRASLGLLNSRYNGYNSPAGEDLNGRDQAHAPSYQYSFSATFGGVSDWFGDIGIQGQDGFYFSDTHDFQSDAHALINSGLGRYIGDFEAHFWIKNLLDQEYSVRGFFFGNDPRTGYADTGWTQMGNPRQFGISIRKDF